VSADAPRTGNGPDGGILHAPPSLERASSFFHGYLAHIQGERDVLTALEAEGRALQTQLAGVSPEREEYRYAPGKWTVREVLGHMIDTERVFQFRALWFARGDSSPLPGFDENRWAEVSGAGERPLASLLAEHAAVRGSSLALFAGLTEEEVNRAGTASGLQVTAGILPWIILGHDRHHRLLYRDRYGIAG
jgi:hypothetical protein